MSLSTVSPACQENTPYFLALAMAGPTPGIRRSTHSTGLGILWTLLNASLDEPSKVSVGSWVKRIP